MCRDRPYFPIAPRYHLSVCSITKVASTINTAIFCYINNRTAFLAGNRRISKESYHTRFCGDSNHYRNLTTVQHLLGDKRIEYVAIRNPISRFLSGYTHICINVGRVEKDICFGCQQNMGCFLESLYSLMVTVQLSIDRGHDMVLTHFAPQTWYCNFKENLSNYNIIRYEEGENRTKKYSDDVDVIFQKAGVPEYIREEIQKEIRDERTVHVTADSEDRIKAEQTLLSNRTLLTILTQIYYYDFIVFDFKLPVIL
ncbi:hypothetical protein Y032_0004g1869 [Ancylostoma ceylanicum]|uniref:Sulfotransferase domain-containing protein n=1 Tax=Ancylostoma ceylanicum TaxID=53326 RepID=A0A016VW16_9BILA|nr:hypothetical protein Y032_0004g1869 [Ancylostoma ceylanicum]